MPPKILMILSESQLIRQNNLGSYENVLKSYSLQVSHESAGSAAEGKED
jgi:hypothetical protein